MRVARRRAPVLAGTAALVIALAMGLLLGRWALAGEPGSGEDLPVVELSERPSKATGLPSQRTAGTGGRQRDADRRAGARKTAGGDRIDRGADEADPAPPSSDDDAGDDD